MLVKVDSMVRSQLHIHVYHFSNIYVIYKITTNTQTDYRNTNDLSINVYSHCAN